MHLATESSKSGSKSFVVPCVRGREPGGLSFDTSTFYCLWGRLIQQVLRTISRSKCYLKSRYCNKEFG
ncbi:uncharacterized protein LAJ45_06091 [Morchella importuna]|uniref:uncharacterized protein n=1 Tax=Morchella importuna TaxID=1174673 RepID=UPI001E8D00C5|nr:uncharacterized protein LAJ45_06091 [Morchella importuna]KAH8149938.1 hypothetical protein LAJ45_06091 [Morchella importuna]